MDPENYEKAVLYCLLCIPKSNSRRRGLALMLQKGVLQNIKWNDANNDFRCIFVYDQCTLIRDMIYLAFLV